MDSLEAAVFYAALILIYGGVEITLENLRNLLDSANFELDTMWTTEFAKALKKQDANDVLRSIGAIESVDPIATNATSGPKGGESESQEDK
ncbi:hypothetical protein TWF703_004953, partial [Orbilia oligospora]